VWQGITLWRFKPVPVTSAGGPAHESHFWRNYGAGLLLMFGHVQAMLFYAALLPGFVDFSSLSAWDIALVALTLVVVIGGINAAYAVLGSRARHFFADASAQRTLHRVAGTLMLLAAVLVATRV
jgi:threonine/homoserine/homoserine lactone efflux protein